MARHIRQGNNVAIRYIDKNDEEHMIKKEGIYISAVRVIVIR